MNEVKIGDTIYRPFDPHDGGGVATQHLKVKEILHRTVYCTYGAGAEVTLDMDDEGKTWYRNYKSCHRYVIRKHGCKDEFDWHCKCNGIRSEEAKAVELERMTKLYLCKTREQLCTLL